MKILINFIKHDIKKKVSGSYFGYFWLVFKPIISILIMWWVFTYGFRTPPVSNQGSFIVWLSSGLIIWFFLADSLSAATESLIEYRFLLKQSAFSAYKIIFAKIATSNISLLSLLILLSFLYIYTQEKHSIYVFLSIYYIIALQILIFAMSLIMAPIRLFIKDVSDILNSLLQLFFWLTPVIWNINFINIEYRWMVFINPITYIIEGMRLSFSPNPTQIEWGLFIQGTLYFWCITGILICIGTILFNKLKPHFNEII